MNKQMLRVALFGASLAVGSWAGTLKAQDAPAPPAQQPQQQPPRRGRFDPAQMLKNYRDQFEGLDLTDDQMAKIDKFLATAEAGIKDLAGQTGQDARRAQGQVMRTLRDDVDSVLTDKQKELLRKKRQQQMFDRMSKGYTDPKLNLTDDQKTKITALLDETKKTMESLSFQNPDDRPKIQQAMKDLHDKVNALLTPEQQKLLPPMGRRGGRGGRGGPNGQPATPPPAPPAA